MREAGDGRGGAILPGPAPRRPFERDGQGRGRGRVGREVRVGRRVKSSDLSGLQSKKLLDEFETWARQSVTGEPTAK